MTPQTHMKKKKVIAFTFIREVQTIAPAFTMGLWGLSANQQELSQHAVEDQRVNIQSGP